MEKYNVLNDYRHGSISYVYTEEEDCDLYSKLPERRLLTAVLERAILDLNHSDSCVRKSAELWFESQDSEEVPFSYKYICDHLDLDCSKVIKLSYNRRKTLIRKKYK